MIIRYRALGGFLALLLTAGVARAQERPPGPARMAVVVGANASAPGRKPLQFSHRDAERMADVLVSVGGFPRQSVLVLKDPSPGALLGSLTAVSDQLAGAADSMLYFYYSGHADEAALYPGGRAVSLADVRDLIDRAKVSVKIGVVDACRGGSWTRTKGLVAEDPFVVKWPLSLDNEGSVLIASSSGIESAHESDDLQGSFFTYHFTGGLRGAADRNGDGVVTLSEGFEYAKEHTIRDTMRLTRETQRPSYAVNLRGRRDLVLAQVAASPSTLSLAQSQGPLELIHAESGLQLLELPPGPRRVKLAVPPGHYLVRKRAPRGNLMREVVVTVGVPSTIAEDQLTLVGQERLAVASKGPPLPRPPRAAPVDPPVLQVAAAPAAEPEVSEWIQVGAVSTAVAAVASLGLAVKFAFDALHYDKELNKYRRFPCNGSRMDINCDQSGTQRLFVLDESHIRHRTELQEQGEKFEGYQRAALLVAGAATAISATLFTLWYRGNRPATTEQDVSFQLLPAVSPQSQGLTGVLRF